MRMLQVFMTDIMDNPSLADLLPDSTEYLDFFERGARTGEMPDFQTPNVDVYVVDSDDLPSPHKLAG